MEYLLGAQRICCAVEHKGTLLLKGHLTPLAITEATWLPIAQEQQCRASATNSYKECPGLGYPSIFHPFSSVGNAFVVQVTGSNLTSNDYFIEMLARA